MGDPFLNYFALFLLIFVVVVLFYGIIAIHDIPHMIAKARQHPHQDAIYAAGWVSLSTLHALWPFLWIWAMAYRPERGWGFAGRPSRPARAHRPPQRAGGSCGAGSPSSKSHQWEREAGNGTPADPDLRLDLLRDLQDVPDTGQSVVAGDRGAGRHHRHSLILLIMNYNHPFTNNARIYFAVTPVLPAVKGRVIEVPVQTNTPLKEGDELFARSEAVPIRRQSEESLAGGSRAERQAAEGLARPGDRRHRKGQGAVRAGAAELRPAGRAVRKEGHRSGNARYLPTQSRDGETVVDGDQAEEERARLAYTANGRHQHRSRACEPRWRTPNMTLIRP